MNTAAPQDDVVFSGARRPLLHVSLMGPDGCSPTPHPPRAVRTCSRGVYLEMLPWGWGFIGWADHAN